MIDHEAAMNDDPILRERFLRELRHARHLVHERGDHAVVSRHEGEVSLDFSAAPPRIVAAIARDDLRAGLVAGIVSAARLSQISLVIDEGLRVDPAAAGFGPDGIFHPSRCP